MLTISKTCPPTPVEAKALADQLLNNLNGDELHKAFDQASNAILSSLGYSDFVDTFVHATDGYHKSSRSVAGGFRAMIGENL
jgi:hypothetical protein